jgi:hypothetical protein
MNKCILQFWEESERGWGTRPDGCTIHINENFREKYINGVYSYRESSPTIPDEYDRPIGNPIECFVLDDLYEKIDQIGSIRILEYEKNNLIKMGEIIIKPNI